MVLSLIKWEHAQGPAAILQARDPLALFAGRVEARKGHNRGVPQVLLVSQVRAMLISIEIVWGHRREPLGRWPCPRSDPRPGRPCSG